MSYKSDARHYSKDFVMRKSSYRRLKRAGTKARTRIARRAGRSAVLASLEAWQDDHTPPPCDGCLRPADDCVCVVVGVLCRACGCRHDF